MLPQKERDRWNKHSSFSLKPGISQTKGWKEAGKKAGWKAVNSRNRLNRLGREKNEKKGNEGGEAGRQELLLVFPFYSRERKDGRERKAIVYSSLSFSLSCAARLYTILETHAQNTEVAADGRRRICSFLLFLSSL